MWGPGKSLTDPMFRLGVRDPDLPEDDWYAGGKISCFAGGLGVKLDIELRQIDSSSVRMRAVGTLECPPNPYP